MWPGTGKTTLAHKLKAEVEESGNSAIVLSTDDHWMEDGEYKFDIKRIGEAHEWNLGRVKDAINVYDCIIVDNTNIVWNDFKKYIGVAVTYNYTVMLAEPKTDWKNDVDECDEKNTHNVPKWVIDKMLHKYQSNAEIIIYAQSLMGSLGRVVDIYEYDPLNLFRK